MDPIYLVIDRRGIVVHISRTHAGATAYGRWFLRDGGWEIDEA